MIEDAVDRVGFGDKGDDAHSLVAVGTRERVDLEDASQQLGPASFCVAYGLRFRLYRDERVVLVLLVRFGGLATFSSDPGRVEAIVTLQHLVFLWDVTR